jgi:hypothetical protein
MPMSPFTEVAAQISLEQLILVLAGFVSAVDRPISIEQLCLLLIQLSSKLN